MKCRLKIAVLTGCVLSAALVVVLAYQGMSTRPEITSTFSQPNNEKGMISPETNIVLTGCTADSDGKGKTDVSCPPYPVFHVSRDPPIKMSKWSGVQLTINNDQYVIQYTTPTGTNQYTLFASDA